jgi:D-serine deaminase-like pyridoxal phosphate-dependent protein
VFHDATQVALGAATIDQCALRVLTTVVSTPTPGRIVVDAGSKAIGRELMSPGTRGFGVALAPQPLAITALYEEHGLLEASGDLAGVHIGDRLEIIPNHACVTANLHGSYVIRRGEEIVDVVPVQARGWRA